jgi:hypothetical protein
MDKSEKERTGNLEEEDAPMILEDPELAELSLHLRQPLPPIIDSVYRETLQSMLPETVLAQRPRKGHDEIGDEGIGLETNSTANTSGADTKKSTDEPDTPALEDNAELATLTCHLQQTAVTLPIDPRFQETLQEKLLEVVRKPSSTASRKGFRRVLALKSGYPM